MSLPNVHTQFLLVDFCSSQLAGHRGKAGKSYGSVRKQLMQLRHRCPRGGVRRPDLALPTVLARDPRADGGQGGSCRGSCDFQEAARWQ